MSETERRGRITALSKDPNRNMFDHTYKLHLRTHKSPISSYNQGFTVYIYIYIYIYICNVCMLI